MKYIKNNKSQYVIIIIYYYVLYYYDLLLYIYYYYIFCRALTPRPRDNDGGRIGHPSPPRPVAPLYTGLYMRPGRLNLDFAGCPAELYIYIYIYIYIYMYVCIYIYIYIYVI